MFVIEPYHWFVFGIALSVFEIFIPSFTLLWFGLSAVVVSLILFIFPEFTVVSQILTWSILSVVVMIAWFKFIKPLSKDKTLAGMPREATIGQIGVVVKVVADTNDVTVRFVLPILGNDEWSCRTLSPVSLGDSVTVKDILGNQLVVDSY